MSDNRNVNGAFNFWKQKSIQIQEETEKYNARRNLSSTNLLKNSGDIENNNNNNRTTETIELSDKDFNHEIIYNRFLEKINSENNPIKLRLILVKKTGLKIEISKVSAKLNELVKSMDIVQRSAQEKEINFAETVRITTILHYYLEFTLLPFYNSTYNLNLTYEQFKGLYVSEDAQKIAGKVRLDRIRDFVRDWNQDVHLNTQSRAEEYVNAVKNAYNNNSNIQKSLSKMYDTLESVFQHVTGDKNFSLEE
ncbi:RasGEF domain-containing protein [Tieghemostelium lacteum]|uniref:RasGEF domain-containing protein n=1 Tax=Tieghemostelium lacteum TaxID=361077 RepID=A0A151Z597_TIELA|nr:RasGEF domain-containing protein [Tieghemostelium lacteum]|eukprot:KYQ89142.1 RasGEF domain-containing protein [Tieghemostelium lacteum]